MKADPIEVRRPLGDNPTTATLFYGASCLETLRGLPDGAIHCVVTSPPYWGLRDYGGESQAWGGSLECEHEWAEQTCQRCGAWFGQFGLEPTPQKYTENLVEVFREIRRVLRDDGTVWLNLGDSYAGAGPSGASYQSETTKRRAGQKRDGNFAISKTLGERGLSYKTKKPIPPPGLKHKDLVGIPWRSAFALQDDGWYLRSEIIWHKLNPLPESVRDRVTRSHEHIFMLAKSSRYFYDHDAIKEPLQMTPRSGARQDAMRQDKKYDYEVHEDPYQQGPSNGRNKRSTCGCPEHVPIPCQVLDPFSGSETTGVVCLDHGRDYVGLDLNSSYLELATARLLGDTPPTQADEGEDGGILELFGVQAE